MKVNANQRESGLTLIEVLIVVTVRAVLVAMRLPAMARGRRPSSRLGCVNNLKQIGISYRQWALDNNDRYPMKVSISNTGAMEWVEQCNVGLSDGSVQGYSTTRLRDALANMGDSTNRIIIP